MTNPNHQASLREQKVLPLAVAVLVDGDLSDLTKTLQNVRTFSDEIYLLDIDPSEVTLAGIAAEELQDRFLAVERCRDLGGARNRLIDFVEKDSVERGLSIDWLLWINAGEQFDPETIDDFARFMECESDRDSLYVQVLRRYYNPDRSRHDLDEETIDARLMPLRKGLRYTGQVKESLFQSATSLLLKISAAPGRIVCPSKFREPHLRLIRAARNLKRIETIESSGTPVTDELLLLRAEVRNELSDHSGARQDFQQLIAKTSKANLRLEAYYGLWETLILAPIHRDETTKILLESLEHFPVDFQLLTFMGRHMQLIDRPELACRTFDTAIRYGQISLDVWHRLHLREIAIVGLALTHRLQGHTREAIDVLETYIDQVDDMSEYARYLFDLYILEGEELKAHELAGRIWREEPLSLMRDVLSGACQVSAGTYETALPLLETAYRAGCSDPLCLRWYSICLLSLRFFSRAIPVLKQWSSVSPKSVEVQGYLHAANHPEQFEEILRQIRSGSWKSPVPVDMSSADAIREMVDASATGTSNLVYRETP